VSSRCVSPPTARGPTTSASDYNKGRRRRP
jgi:hypothetical protein